ncbi:TetR/AcrR family transcriptional regulator [Lacrimispora algidixylanolytica]|uniref:AcrR family transcriptional regulator n=1 Tax=Lacrimispora algidixylanolytica TaxID=94868 RepID=A0A419T314_9FIRM|nr:TetR/AcrR family transcriptional regulator [Lacrimispora algidixylanolytica]RKD31852.1 AcrR family transcriptional regulator [Lacrimispora algidixylanolytica]
MNKNVSRRRGTTLENAILDQAWLLIQQTGYGGMTMIDVAHAAKTNKNAIYRRWSQKCHLVMTALSRQVPEINFEISDHGSLKEDLTALFESLNPIFNIIKPDDLRDLISDMFSNIASYDFFSGSNHENSIRKSIEAIILRANYRNEVSLSINTISEKALNLPYLLIINEIVLHGTLVESSIEDIIDNILLPIYMAHK